MVAKLHAHRTTEYGQSLDMRGDALPSVEATRGHRDLRAQLVVNAHPRRYVFDLQVAAGGLPVVVGGVAVAMVNRKADNLVLVETVDIVPVGQEVVGDMSPDDHVADSEDGEAGRMHRTIGDSLENSVRATRCALERRLGFVPKPE